ncbi:MAG TPA: class I SAM-dependent methyltransferase [Galbitalea sp.]|jgi:SAM-dependent methyltransferase|nr:class I SAM-dependent methyltransferase [Galbitalea sp.]
MDAQRQERLRLAELSDPFDPDRSDLEVYVDIAREVGARSVLDVGCGTGSFALMLVTEGIEVTAVDPDDGAITVAKRKSGAERVRWIVGDAESLPPLQVDLATMTANVAQVFVTDEAWLGTLRGIRGALRPGGRLVFETRDPDRRAWEDWATDDARETVEVPDIGPVETWLEILEVAPPLVSFRFTNLFASDGSTIVSDSTLRWRSREEVEASLAVAGFSVDEIRDAPDRPGREFVFLATRRE